MNDSSTIPTINRNTGVRSATVNEFHIVADNGCWLWQGNVNRKGYGGVRVNGRRMTAHRAYYEKYVGAIPEGMQIDHLCSNPSCVNPDHLEAVSIAENIRRSRQAKLTASDVRAIRTMFNEGISHSRIGAFFGVSAGCISKISNGTHWGDVR